MNYNIKGTGVSITPEIREYLEKKLAALEKFVVQKDLARADVELQFLQGEARMYRAELMLHGQEKILRAEARGTTLHEALDLSVGDMTREVTQLKKKRIHVVRRSAAKVKDMLRGLRDRF